MIIFSNSNNIKLRTVIYLGSLFLGVIVGSIIYQILGDSEKLKLVIYSKYLSDNLYMEKVNHLFCGNIVLVHLILGFLLVVVQIFLKILET